MTLEFDADGAFVVPAGFRMLSGDEQVKEWDMWADEMSTEWQVSISWRRNKKASDGCVGYGLASCCYIREIPKASEQAADIEV